MATEAPEVAPRGLPAEAADRPAKVRLATVWLDGCSGCHMSFLDVDERLIELASLVEVVHSPLVDLKGFPEHVDVAIVEGAVSTDEDLHKIKLVRRRSRVLIALGDCAITGNISSLRNPVGVEPCMERAFVENATLQSQYPCKALPRLLERVMPVHEVVPVDVFVPGCPPPADAIWQVVVDLLAGRAPDPGKLTRFGR